MAKIKSAKPNEVAGSLVAKPTFHWPYKQLAAFKKKGKPSSEKQRGRRKRWYVQYWPNWATNIPATATSYSKLGVHQQRVAGPQKAHCQIAKG